MHVMVSLIVTMSSSSCSVSNRFPNSSWNSVFFYLICLLSPLRGLMVIISFVSTSTSSLMLSQPLCGHLQCRFHQHALVVVFRARVAASPRRCCERTAAKAGYTATNASVSSAAHWTRLLHLRHRLLLSAARNIRSCPVC